MFKFSRAGIAAACLLCAAGTWAQTGDERFFAARDAIRSGDRVTLERLAAQPSAHPLDPYVRYWLLFNKLARPEAPPANELNDFLVREAGSMLAERLRGDWLRRLARDGDWGAYNQLQADLQNPDGELRCHGWTARLMKGESDVLAEIAHQWEALDEAHGTCETVFRAAVDRGTVTLDQVWRRFRDQVDSRTPGNARGTLAWLSATDGPALDHAIRSPAQYLDRLPPNFAVTRTGRELAVAALVRLAREDTGGAHTRLVRLQDRLEGSERAHVYAALGHRAAQAQSADAVAWFRAAGDTQMRSEQRAWRVRAALRSSDWSGVLNAIERLPAAEQDLPDWVYWRARALAAGGRGAEANALYERIAGDLHFYGLLASEELNRPFAPPAAGGGPDPLQLRAVQADPGIQRALALFRLDMRTEGVREWNWSLRGQDEQFRLAAARLALQHGIYDRAINTAELASPRGAFDLRFLTPYRELIEPQVRNQGLDMSWVYGLMRQESRFVVPARSSAGAQGLMQVMPATGKWVAGKLGMSDYHAWKLADPNTNVQLGTGYMRIILEDLDNHPVLASAGYNAGPGRAKRWRDTRPLEGAIYAETIPFDETRDYVKKVMANTVIYATLLEGRAQSLKSRLGTVTPRPDAR